ncbi:lamin tail domain-containing protein [Streptomyces goshikiensis]|uniref:lamin tail domain-containing protein n=1 Tax=Streptomyces goshikiensis TaxID=1942 RepID=UPI0033E5861E
MPRTHRLAAGAAITAATVLLLPGQAHAAGALRISKIWYDSPGSDTGTNASLNGEWVQITNSTGTAVSLRGWTLTDASRHTYTFPAFTLKPGKPSPSRPDAARTPPRSTSSAAPTSGTTTRTPPPSTAPTAPSTTPAPTTPPATTTKPAKPDRPPQQVRR